MSFSANWQTPDVPSANRGFNYSQAQTANQGRPSNVYLGAVGSYLKDTVSPFIEAYAQRQAVAEAQKREQEYRQQLLDLQKAYFKKFYDVGQPASADSSPDTGTDTSMAAGEDNG